MPKDWRFTLALALLGIVVSAASGYYSGLAAIGERVRAVEVRQEEQFRAVLVRVEDLSVRTRQGHEDIRMDLNGVRGEILSLLKERR